VSVPARAAPRRPGVVVHRRRELDRTTRDGIPVTPVAATLVDLAARLDTGPLERAVNEADRLDLGDPERLRAELERMSRRPGLETLRATLDRRTFALTDSELERRFLVLVRRAQLATPETGRRVNGFKVDFFWPELGLVIETDGLRYHRTPAEQARDRVRDHAHTAAGLTAIRFTHGQIAFEPGYVVSTLIEVARRAGHLHMLRAA
jgi:very-short-patch-repair endonuclease